MKQHLLTTAVLCGTMFSAVAQVTLTKTLPPFGTQYVLGQAGSTSLSQPTTGPDQVWDYSGLTISPLYTYTITDPTTVKQEYQDSCPTAKYVEILAIPGVPSPDLNPMDFMTDDSDALIRVGQKGSGSEMSTSYDTIFVFNQTYQSTQNYGGRSYTYAGYGSLKVKSKTYDNIALLIASAPNSPDTSFIFYSFAPHYQRLFALGWTGGASVGVTLWEPKAAGNTGIRESSILNCTVYPNPVSDDLTIELPFASTSCTATLYTIQGKKVFTQSIENSQSSINLSEITPGLYFITVSGNGKSFTQKIIKK